MHITPCLIPVFEKVASYFEEPSKILMRFDFVTVHFYFDIDSAIDYFHRV